MDTPHQRRSGAATPGWWPWTGTLTPSSGTPTSDPSGQTWRRCPIMFGSNKLSVEPTCSTAWLAMIMERSTLSTNFFWELYSQRKLHFPPVTHRSQVWFRERAAFQNTVETSVYVRDGCQGRGTVLYLESLRRC